MQNSENEIFNSSNNINLQNTNNNNYSYYQKLMKMSYQELVSFLQQKYGKVNGDYFLDKECKKQNCSIKKGSEGLFIHHIDEDKAIMLAVSEYAINNPFDYQKANRLVYCNLLEHYLLHILIYEEQKPENANQKEKQGLGGAINYICIELNNCYGGYNYKKEFSKVAKSLIINDYDSYVLMAKRLWHDIKNDNMLSTDRKKVALIKLVINKNKDVDKNLFSELAKVD